MKKTNLLKMSVFIILMVATLSSANAQWGGKLKDLKKKVTKTTQQVKKITKQVEQATQQEEKQSEKATSSQWQKQIDAQKGKTQQANTNEQASKEQQNSDDPTEKDLARMKRGIEDVYFNLEYIYATFKDPSDGKIYTYFYHDKNKKKIPMSDNETVKKVVAARYALDIFKKYNYSGITEEEMEKYKTRFDALMQGHDNSLAFVKKAEYENDRWKPKKSKAENVNEAMARIKQKVNNRLGKDYKILDIAMDDEWTRSTKNEGVHIRKTEILWGKVLLYNTIEKKYYVLTATAANNYYLQYPNDKEKTVGLFSNELTYLEKEQVPKQFWQ